MKSWERFWSQLSKSPTQRLDLYRLGMIQIEVGSLTTAIIYRYGYGGKGYGKGFNAEIKKSLADLLAMTLMMAFSEGIHLGELYELAQEELNEFIQKRLPTMQTEKPSY